LFAGEQECRHELPTDNDEGMGHAPKSACRNGSAPVSQTSRDPPKNAVKPLISKAFTRISVGSAHATKNESEQPLFFVNYSELTQDNRIW